MALSRPARTAIAGEHPGAQTTLVVTQQLASSRRSLSVIPATRIAVHPLASLPQMAQYVVLVLAFAILKRSAAARQHLVLLTKQLQMVRFPFLGLLLLLMVFRDLVWELALVRLWTVHIP